MLPPLARGGIVDNISSLSGATPIIPGKGRSGTLMRSVKATDVLLELMSKVRK